MGPEHQHRIAQYVLPVARDTRLSPEFSRRDSMYRLADDVKVSLPREYFPIGVPFEAMEL